MSDGEAGLSDRDVAVNGAGDEAAAQQAGEDALETPVYGSFSVSYRPTPYKVNSLSLSLSYTHTL